MNDRDDFNHSIDRDSWLPNTSDNHGASHSDSSLSDLNPFDINSLGEPDWQNNPFSGSDRTALGLENHQSLLELASDLNPLSSEPGDRHNSLANGQYDSGIADFASWQSLEIDSTSDRLSDEQIHSDYSHLDLASPSNAIGSLDRQDAPSNLLDTHSHLNDSNLTTESAGIAELGHTEGHLSAIDSSSLHPSRITLGCQQKMSVFYYSDFDDIKVNNNTQVRVRGRSFYRPIPGGSERYLGHMDASGNIYDAHNCKIGHADRGCAWDNSGDVVTSGWNSDRLAAAGLIAKRHS